MPDLSGALQDRVGKCRIGQKVQGGSLQGLPRDACPTDGNHILKYFLVRRPQAKREDHECRAFEAREKEDRIEAARRERDLLARHLR
jgi:hypothetical protein